VTIPPGALMISDPLDFDLAPLSALAITIHLAGVPETVTYHPGSRSTSFLQTGDSVGSPDLANAAHVDHWYFINGVDVWSRNASAAVVTLGDSITDGAKTTTNRNARWPDGLARRLHDNKKTANVAVLNEGIGGNRLLRDGAGPNALARFDRDVLAQAGVRWLVILEGVNDIGNGGSASSVTSAFARMISQARAQNLLVYGVPILPFGGSSYDNALNQSARTSINAYIRSGPFDAVIDLSTPIADPSNPTNVLSTYDSGDHLHLNSAGYRTMAYAVDISLFAQ